MRVGRLWRLVAAAGVAATVAGCGLGPGAASEGEAALTVTRDYGATPMLEATATDPPESDTVLRFLDREAEIGTRYGGGFVQSIEGISGRYAGGRSLDWFFYVDGVESPLGSADRQVRAGQRIWWDYHDWTDAMRAPAVVGSWPEPFAQEAADDHLPVRIDCRTRPTPCEAVKRKLAAEGVDARLDSDAPAGDELRLLVGPWATIRRDPAAAKLDGEPSASGVFARFGGDRLVGLDDHANPVVSYSSGAGLVAAVGEGEDPPVWLITGTDAAGVESASRLLDTASLEDRFAVLTHGAYVTGLPVPP